MKRHLVILTVLTLLCIGLAVLFVHCAYGQELGYSTPDTGSQVLAGLGLVLLLLLAAYAFVRFISRQ